MRWATFELSRIREGDPAALFYTSVKLSNSSSTALWLRFCTRKQSTVRLLAARVGHDEAAIETVIHARTHDRQGLEVCLWKNISEQDAHLQLIQLDPARPNADLEAFRRKPDHIVRQSIVQRIEQKGFCHPDSRQVHASTEGLKQGSERESA